MWAGTWEMWAGSRCAWGKKVKDVGGRERETDVGKRGRGEGGREMKVGDRQTVR